MVVIKKFKKIVVIFALILVTSFFVSETTVPYLGVVNVEAATKLNKTKATLIKGKTLTLKLNGINSSKVAWSSSKTSVATVKKGVVTGKKKGTTTIVAKYKNKKYTCAVTIETPKINMTSANLYVGNTITLKMNGNSQKITWNSSNKSVATVKSNGVVNGIKAGNTTITAKVGGVTYKCKVTVKSVDIKFDKTALIMKLGESATLNVSVTPSSYQSKVTWSSSNSNIVSVSNGILTAVGTGMCTVTANVDNVKASCVVQVQQTYGTVTGKITYYYNNYKGNVSDTGSLVILINKNKNALKMPILNSYVEWDRLSTINGYNEYGVYEARVDGTGSYIFNDIPTGEYYVLVRSTNTKSGAAFTDKNAYALSVANSIKGYIPDINAEMLGEYMGYQKYTKNQITIYSDRTTTFSYDFGITY